MLLPWVVVGWFPPAARAVLGLGATALPTLPSIWARRQGIPPCPHHDGGDFWKSLCVMVLSMEQVIAGAERMARTDTNP